jgi:hypothetical protein
MVIRRRNNSRYEPLQVRTQSGKGWQESNQKRVCDDSRTTTVWFHEEGVYCFAQEVTHWRVRFCHGCQQYMTDAMYMHVRSEIEAITWERMRRPR